MIILISFLLVLIGCINWLCIGILQYDFVAGLFGSQANVFSRILYAVIGIASLVLVYAAIRTKGCIKCNGKRSSDQELKLIKKKDKNKDSDKNNQQNDNNMPQNQQQPQYNQNNMSQQNGQYPPQNNGNMPQQINNQYGDSSGNRPHDGQQPNTSNYNQYNPGQDNPQQNNEPYQGNAPQNSGPYKGDGQQQNYQ